MLSPFSSDDLGRVFDARTLTRGRSLVLLGAVEVTLDAETVVAVVEHAGFQRRATITPSSLGRRVMFVNACSCGQPACVHLAAGCLAALDRFPALRKPVQKTLFESLTAAPAEERQALAFELAPGEPPHACFVSTLLIGERSGRREATTPARILAERSGPESNRIMAKMLGGGDVGRVGVAPGAVASLLGLLARIGRGRWHATGKALTLGEERSFAANMPPNLPPKSAVILGDSGPWYVDGATGAVGRIRLRPPQAGQAAPVSPPAKTPIPQRPIPPRFPIRRHVATAPTAVEPVIVERKMTPVLRLTRMQSPDEFGRSAPIDALAIDFDYDGVLVPADDDRQFVKVQLQGQPPSFVRRDRDGEAAALAALRQDGFNQMRIAEGPTAKGRIVYVHRGRDASERWQAFVAERLPALEALGWRNRIDRDFGPRNVQSVGDYDVRVSDAERGRFSLDFGIEIDGARIPLLPILSRLLERGGMDAALIADGELVTSLDDGRILKLPAERIRRLLAVMADLIEAAHRSANDQLVLSDGEAPTVLDLEDLLTTRWDDAAAIASYAEQFRSPAELPEAPIPRQLHRQPAPLSGGRRRLAAASARARAGRLPGRRHGAGQDRADHRPSRHRARARPARPPRADRRADQPGEQLEGGGWRSSRRACGSRCCTAWTGTPAAPGWIARMS